MMTRTKSNPCNIFSATLLLSMVIYVLGTADVTAQIPSIEGQVYPCETSTCACCEDGDCEEACADGSCVSCQTAACDQNRETPLACSYSVCPTDAIPPHADCPTMDDKSIVVATSTPPMMESLSMDQYCADMAELLAKSLANSDVDPETRQFAIESAMKMAVRNSELQLKSQFEKMKARYQQELISYRNYAADAAARTQSTKDVQQWMSPIYQNLERNFQQMRLMQASNVNMDRTLRLLEQMAKETLGDPNPPRQRITLRSPQPNTQAYPSVQRTKDSAEVEQLKNQVAQLQAQLNSMQVLQYPASSRPAVRQASANHPLPFQQRALPVLEQRYQYRPMNQQRSSEPLAPLRR